MRVQPPPGRLVFTQLDPRQQVGLDRDEGPEPSAPLRLGRRALARRPDGAGRGQKQVAERESCTEKSSAFGLPAALCAAGELAAARCDIFFMT